MVYRDLPRILTDVYTYSGERFGNGIAVGDGFFAIPYVIGRNVPWEQYNELRTLLLEEFVAENTPVAVLSHRAGVYAYLYGKDKRVLVAVNSTESSFESVSLEAVGFEVRSARAIDRKSGEPVEVAVTRSGKMTRFAIPLPTLSTVVLLID